MDFYNKTWNLIENTKYKQLWISEKIKQFQKRERTINIILALTSSSSISGWIIWKEYAMIWATIIALSQLVQVSKPLFPFTKYIKELQNKYIILEKLNLELEKLWYNQQFDKLSEEEIETQYFDLKERITDILQFSSDLIMNESAKLEKKAEKGLKTYIKLTYQNS